MDERRIARKIKELRQSKDLTLDKVAELTGLTKGYLSRIENSEKSPPVSTLAKIAGAYHMDLISFLSDDDEMILDENIEVVKRKDRKRIGSLGAPSGYAYESLAYRMPGKNMNPYIITLSDRNFVDEFQHEGEEFIFMLEGKAEFILKNTTYTLEEGDSIYFDSSIPHSGRNLGIKPARFLCMIYSYKRI